MSGTEKFEEEEISLLELWETLRRGRRYIVGGLLIGVLGVATTLSVVPKQYEALVLLQVGQVGQVGLFGQVGVSMPVEPATQVVERMKSSAFQLKVAQAVGDQGWINALQSAGATASSRFVPQLVKATSVQGATALIELRVKVESGESARALAGASVAELSKTHDELAKPLVEQMSRDLELAKEKQARAERELGGLNKLAASAGAKDDRSTQLSLMTSLRLQKENELFAKQQVVLGLEKALSSPATQHTRAIEDIFVGQQPVSPKSGLVVALGLLGGLLVGVMWAFVVDAWRRAWERRSVRGLPS